MTTAILATRYALFAVAATVLNLGLQSVVLQMVSSPIALYLALLVGTAGGISLKYVLDCRYIFSVARRGARASMVTFVLYTLMGGVTTAIFWGVELLFTTLSGGECAAYLGGAVGLTLGYAVKYQLDKKFVFTRRAYQ